MPKLTDEQEIAALKKRVTKLEAQMQALAVEIAEQLYGHHGEVVWQDKAGCLEAGWLRVVPAGPGKVAAPS